MKEYAFQFDKGLKQGLRPDMRNGRNTQLLTELRGLRPTEFGLDFIPPIEEATMATVVWPFPQLVQGQKRTFLLEAAAVSYLDEDTRIAEPLVVYDALDTNTLLVFDQPTQWQLVDAYNTWMLLNESMVIWRGNLQGMFNQEQKIVGTDTITIQTGCYHKGRCFFGGLTSDFWNSDWQAFMTDQVGVPSINTTLTMDTNFVYWTGIGGGDMLWPIYFDLAVNGNIGLADYGITNPAFIDAIKRNSFGWTPLPTQGNVLKLLPLMDHVIAYCQRGVFALSPVAWPQVGAVGVKPLCPIGSWGRTTAGGSSTQHIWIDPDGFLWSLGGDLKPQRLGYQEFLSDLDLELTAISVGEEEQEFYISDGVRGFLLNKNGFCETNELPTSLINTSLGLKGLVV